MIKAIYASSKDPNMLYAVGADIPDPFFYFETEEEKAIYLDKRELGAFQAHHPDSALQAKPLEPEIGAVREKTGGKGLKFDLASRLFARHTGEAGHVTVPLTFPLDLADHLREEGYELTVQDPYFPARLKKTDREAGFIRKNVALTCEVFAEIETILRDSEAKDGVIHYLGEELTSERLKRLIDIELVKRDMLDVEGMIVSSGKQAARPHDRGSGPLRAGATIICDIFARNKTNLYFADMTRTYVKGRASEDQERMYEAVKQTQEKAIQAIAPGVECKSVYDICAESFRRLGYDVGEKGFVHGTGHGLGLEVHEPPMVNAFSGETLESGHVVTVEPGLYYEELGGVRIEDVILVTENGCENLTDHPKQIMID